MGALPPSGSGRGVRGSGGVEKFGRERVKRVEGSYILGVKEGSEGRGFKSKDEKSGERGL
jgi:hypothetical protein